MANPVIVVEYDPGWPALFQQIRARIADSLAELAVAIEHVGSTSVPGLAAKPIIDIDVLLAAREALPAAIERLAGLGYSYQGDLGIPDREAFKARAGGPSHNLYLWPPGSRELERHLAFRDYLRTHTIEANAYGDLKRSLAIKFRDDRDAYVEGKTDFVNRVTALALASPRRALSR